MKKLILRVFTLFLTSVYLTTNCAFAHKPATNVWVERKQAHQVAALPLSQPGMPLSVALEHSPRRIRPMADLNPGPSRSRMTNLLPYGSIRKILNPQLSSTKAQTIIHIQDIHQNAEAQQNIGRAVAELVKNNQVGLVALEGAFGEIDLKRFQQFPRQDAVKKVADYLLRENRISGPVHALMSKPSPSVIGIDDLAHYNANVQAYRDAAPQVKREKEKLLRLEHQLSKKKKVFNPALAKFDQLVGCYRSGELSLGEYAQNISAHSDGKKFLVVDTYLEALHLEKSLNFSQVETERSHLLSQLLPKLTAGEANELLNLSAAFKDGRLSHADFHSTLENLCDRKGLYLERFPTLKKYLRYVQLTDQVDPEKLFAEIRGLEQKVYVSLSRTKEERQLIAESRELYLAGKLVEFALTREEWDEYKTDENRKSRVDQGVVDLIFEAFYREAEARDEKMAKNLLKAANGPTTVLVTGGFHSSGIDRRLSDAGYNVVTFVPKISKVDTENGSAYLSAFNQQKTPLDNLFEGQKLFLAKNPAELGLAGQLVFLTDKFNRQSLDDDWYQRLTGLREKFSARFTADSAMLSAASVGTLGVYFAQNGSIQRVALERVLPLFAEQSPVQIGLALAFCVLLASLTAWVILRLAQLDDRRYIRQLVEEIALYFPMYEKNYNAMIAAGLDIDRRIAAGLERLLDARRVFDQAANEEKPDLWEYLESAVAHLNRLLARLDLPGSVFLHPNGHVSFLPERVWINSKSETRDALPGDSALTKGAFEYAERRLEGAVRKTPLKELNGLGAITSEITKKEKRVFLKDESKQEAESFKSRGVYYEVLMAIERVIADKSQRALLAQGLKIVTQSTGNHGIALISSVTKIVHELSRVYANDPQMLAWVKKIEPVVFTLNHLPTPKIEAMRSAMSDYHATVDASRGQLLNDYADYAAALESRERFIRDHQGAALYMAHGGRDIMLGHGSAGLEIDRDLTQAGIGDDKNVVLIVNVGAGGPIGVGAALKAVRKNVKVIFVQSNRWDAFVRTMQTGKLQRNPKKVAPTFTIQRNGKPVEMYVADGHAVDGPEEEAVRYAAADVDAGVTVDEASALYGSGVLLREDLLLAYGNEADVKVGGTTMLTAEALLTYANQMEMLRNADAVVLFGTEGNIEDAVTDRLRERRPVVDKIREAYLQGKPLPDMKAAGEPQITMGASHSGTPFWDEVVEASFSRPTMWMSILCLGLLSHFTDDLPLLLHLASGSFAIVLLTGRGSAELVPIFRDWFVRFHFIAWSRSFLWRGLKIYLGFAALAAWFYYVALTFYSWQTIVIGLSLITAASLNLSLLDGYWGSASSTDRKSFLSVYFYRLDRLTLFVYSMAVIILAPLRLWNLGFLRIANITNPVEFFFTMTFEAFFVWALGANLADHIVRNMIRRFFGPTVFMPQLASHTSDEPILAPWEPTAVNQLDGFLQANNVPNKVRYRIEEISEFDASGHSFSGHRRYRGYASVVLPGEWWDEYEIIRSEILTGSTDAEVRELLASKLLDHFKSMIREPYPRQPMKTFPIPIVGEEFTMALHQCAVYFRWAMPVYDVVENKNGEILHVAGRIQVSDDEVIHSDEFPYRALQGEPLVADVFLAHLDMVSRDLLEKLMKRYPQLGDPNVVVYARFDGEPNYFGALNRLEDEQGYSFKYQVDTNQQPSAAHRYGVSMVLKDPAGKEMRAEREGNEVKDLLNDAARIIAEGYLKMKPPAVPHLERFHGNRHLGNSSQLLKLIWQPEEEVWVDIRQVSPDGTAHPTEPARDDKQKRAALIAFANNVDRHLVFFEAGPAHNQEINRLKTYVQRMKFSNHVGIEAEEVSPLFNPRQYPRWHYLVHRVSMKLLVGGRIFSSRKFLAADPVSSVADAAADLLATLQTTFKSASESQAVVAFRPEYPVSLKGVQYKATLDDLLFKLGWKHSITEFMVNPRGDIIQTRVSVEIPGESRRLLRSKWVPGEDVNAPAQDLLDQITRKFASEFFEGAEGNRRNREGMIWRRRGGKLDFLTYLVQWCVGNNRRFSTFHPVSKKEGKAAAEIHVYDSDEERFIGYRMHRPSLDDARNAAAKKHMDELKLTPHKYDVPAEQDNVLLENHEAGPVVHRVPQHPPKFNLAPIPPRPDARVLPITNPYLTNGDLVDLVSVPERFRRLLREIRDRGGECFVIAGEVVRNLVMGTNVVPRIFLNASVARQADVALTYPSPRRPTDLFWGISTPEVRHHHDGVRDMAEPFSTIFDPPPSDLVEQAGNWGTFETEYRIWQDLRHIITSSGRIIFSGPLLSVSAIVLSVAGVVVDPEGGLADLHSEQKPARFVGDLDRMTMEHCLHAFRIKNALSLHWTADSVALIKKFVVELNGVAEQSDWRQDAEFRSNFVSRWSRLLEDLFRDATDPYTAYTDLLAFGLPRTINQMCGEGFVEIFRDQAFYRRYGMGSERIGDFLTQHEGTFNDDVRGSRRNGWFVSYIPSPIGEDGTLYLAGLEDVVDDYPQYRPQTAEYHFVDLPGLRTIGVVMDITLRFKKAAPFRADERRPRRPSRRESEKSWRQESIERLREELKEKHPAYIPPEDTADPEDETIELIYAWDPLKEEYVPEETFVPVKVRSKKKNGKRQSSVDEPATVLEKIDPTQQLYLDMQEQHKKAQEVEERILRVLNSREYVDPDGRLDRKKSVKNEDERYEIVPIFKEFFDRVVLGSQLRIDEVAYHALRWMILLLVVESGLNPTIRLVTVLKKLAEIERFDLIEIIFRDLLKYEKSGEFVLSYGQNKSWYIDVGRRSSEHAPVHDLGRALHQPTKTYYIAINNEDRELSLFIEQLHWQGVPPLLERHVAGATAFRYFQELERRYSPTTVTNQPSATIAGTIGGNPLLAAFWEKIFWVPALALFILIAIFLPPVFSALLLSGFGYAGPPQLAIMLSVLTGYLAYRLAIPLTQRLYVLAHSKSALERVNKHREEILTKRGELFEEYEMDDYRHHLENLFDKINAPVRVMADVWGLLLVFGITDAASTWGAMAIALVVAALVHLRNNVRFMRGDFARAPVLGSSGDGNLLAWDRMFTATPQDIPKAIVMSYVLEHEQVLINKAHEFFKQETLENLRLALRAAVRNWLTYPQFNGETLPAGFVATILHGIDVAPDDFLRRISFLNVLEIIKKEHEVRKRLAEVEADVRASYSEVWATRLTRLVWEANREIYLKDRTDKFVRQQLGLIPGSPLLTRFDQEFDRVVAEITGGRPATAKFINHLWQRQEAEFLDRNMAWMVTHAKGVTVVGTYLAKANPALKVDLPNYVLGLMFHDIGKLRVSADIWNATGDLTEEQRDETRRHVTEAKEQIGEYFSAFLSENPNISKALESENFNWELITAIAEQHHERLNATGYPGKLTGDKLTNEVKLAMVADIFVAKWELRPYQYAQPPMLGRDLAVKLVELGHLDKDIVASLDWIIAEHPNVFYDPPIDPLEIQYAPSLPSRTSRPGAAVHDLLVGVAIAAFLVWVLIAVPNDWPHLKSAVVTFVVALATAYALFKKGGNYRLAALVFAVIALDHFSTIVSVFLISAETGLRWLSYISHYNTRLNWIFNSLFFVMMSIWLWATGRLTIPAMSGSDQALVPSVKKIRWIWAAWLGAWTGWGLEALLTDRRVQYLMFNMDGVRAVNRMADVVAWFALPLLGWFLLQHGWKKLRKSKETHHQISMANRRDYEPSSVEGGLWLAIAAFPVFIFIDQLVKWLLLVRPVDISLGRLTISPWLSHFGEVMIGRYEINAPYSLAMIALQANLMVFVWARHWQRWRHEKMSLPDKQKHHPAGASFVATGITAMAGALLADAVRWVGTDPSLPAGTVWEAALSLLSAVMILIGFFVASAGFYLSSSDKSEFQWNLITLVLSLMILLPIYYFSVVPWIHEFAEAGTYWKIFQPSGIVGFPALSLGHGTAAAFVFLSAMFVVLVVWLLFAGKLFIVSEAARIYPKIEKDHQWVWGGLALILAGLISTGIDHVFHGHAVNIVNLYFSFSDIAFVVGWILVFRGLGGMNIAEDANSTLTAPPAVIESPESGQRVRPLLLYWTVFPTFVLEMAAASGLVNAGMIDGSLSLVAVVASLAIAVFIHEGSHYLMAKFVAWIERENEDPPLGPEMVWPWSRLGNAVRIGVQFSSQPIAVLAAPLLPAIAWFLVPATIPIPVEWAPVVDIFQSTSVTLSILAYVPFESIFAHLGYADDAAFEDGRYATDGDELLYRFWGRFNNVQQASFPLLAIHATIEENLDRQGFDLGLRQLSERPELLMLVSDDMVKNMNRSVLKDMVGENQKIYVVAQSKDSAVQMERFLREMKHATWHISANVVPKLFKSKKISIDEFDQVVRMIRARFVPQSHLYDNLGLVYPWKTTFVGTYEQEARFFTAFGHRFVTAEWNGGYRVKLRVNKDA